MILDTLRSFVEAPPDSMKALEPKDYVRPGETVLGTLTPLQIGLFVVLRAEIEALKRDEAAALSARAKEVLDRTAENLELVDSADRQLCARAERFNVMSLLFRLDIVEEFKVDDDFAIGIREGFKVVKFTKSESLAVEVFRFTHSTEL